MAEQESRDAKKTQISTQLCGSLIHPERKAQYFLWLTRQGKASSYASYLRKSGAALETRFHKDLCEFTMDEARQGFAELNYLLLASLRSLLHAIRHYIAWCRQEGYLSDAPHPFELLKSKDLSLVGAVRRMLLLPEDLVSIAETVSDLNGGNPELAVLCLGWCGLSLEDCLALPDEAVDLLQGTLRMPGTGACIALPTELLPLLRGYRNGRESAGDGRFLQRRIISQINRKMAGVPLKPIEIRNAISRLMRRYQAVTGRERAFDLSTVTLFGALYRMYDFDIRNGGLSDSHMLREHPVNTTTTKAATELRDLRRLYEAYRQVRAQREETL